VSFVEGFTNDGGKTMSVLLNQVRELLHPQRFTHMSGKMAAIVACILGGDPVTSPTLVELCITSDGLLMGRLEGDCGFNEMLGSERDLARNWSALLDAAGLTPEQREEADTWYQNILHW
jgi:hypothetical protein